LAAEWRKAHATELDSVCVYVDDLALAARKKEQVVSTKQKLMTGRKMTENPAVDFMLGMKVERDYKEKRIYLSNSAYADLLLERFGMEASRDANTPLESNFKLDQKSPVFGDKVRY
jgi:hypothetical protein